MAPDSTNFPTWDSLQILARSVGIRLPATRSEAVIAAYAEYLRYAEMMAALPLGMEEEPAELLDVERAAALANAADPTESEA
jgi:hypothetical protein